MSLEDDGDGGIMVAYVDLSYFSNLDIINEYLGDTYFTTMLSYFIDLHSFRILLVCSIDLLFHLCSLINSY